MSRFDAWGHYSLHHSGEKGYAMFFAATGLPFEENPTHLIAATNLNESLVLRLRGASQSSLEMTQNLVQEGWDIFENPWEVC